MTPRNEARKAALDMVNNIREKMGGEPRDELVKGSPGHSKTCPVSLSILPGTEAAEAVTKVEHVKVRRATYAGGSLHFKTSNKVRDFLHHFDSRSYPDLIIKGA